MKIIPKDEFDKAAETADKFYDIALQTSLPNKEAIRKSFGPVQVVMHRPTGRSVATSLMGAKYLKQIWDRDFNFQYKLLIPDKRQLMVMEKVGQGKPKSFNMEYVDNPYIRLKSYLGGDANIQVKYMGLNERIFVYKNNEHTLVAYFQHPNS